MAASVAQAASKSSKKKAAKGVERTDSPAPSTASGQQGTSNEADETSDHPYIRELQKNIRNVNKKIANASKTDSLLAQNSGKSLDDLVATKILNADQKAQILKKPALQAQVTQFEDQLAQFQILQEQFRTKATDDKTKWTKTSDQAKLDAVKEAKEEFQNVLNENLLVLSQFLRLAAYRREEALEPDADESQAIEGVLLAIYSGDHNAVQSMLKLVEGSSDPIISVPGEQLQTTYAEVKKLANDYETPFQAENTQTSESAPIPNIETDQTIANATVTELEAAPAPMSNGSSTGTATNGLANASVSDGAANAMAESQWDSANNEMSMSQEWVDVKVPRDPAETETGLEATPAAAGNTQSWADDHPEPSADIAASADPNEGFHQVQRNKARNEREGSSWRGRGRGEHRGRGGFRGDGRGRGRGQRGGGMQSRPRRNEESS